MPGALSGSSIGSTSSRGATVSLPSPMPVMPISPNGRRTQPSGPPFRIAPSGHLTDLLDPSELGMVLLLVLINAARVRPAQVARAASPLPATQHRLPPGEGVAATSRTENERAWLGWLLRASGGLPLLRPFSCSASARADPPGFPLAAFKLNMPSMSTIFVVRPSHTEHNETRLRPQEGSRPEISRRRRQPTSTLQAIN